MDTWRAAGAVRNRFEAVQVLRPAADTLTRRDLNIRPSTSIVLAAAAIPTE